MPAILTLANFFEGWNPVVVNLLPAIGLLLIVAGIFSSMKARRRRAAGQLTAREEMERLRQRGAVKGDLEQLMVEIEQLAKRLGGQLDAKAIHLEALLREADAKIVELRKLSEAAPPPAASASDEPTPLAEPGDPLARRVCELADEGLTPVDIARRLDEHVGKIELILALRRAV
jgi:hypothetical protein